MNSITERDLRSNRALRVCGRLGVAYDADIALTTHMFGAGFNHVVFIIRKDIEKEFKEVIGDRIASICSAHNVTSHWGQTPLNTDKENKPGLKVL